MKLHFVLLGLFIASLTNAQVVIKPTQLQRGQKSDNRLAPTNTDQYKLTPENPAIPGLAAFTYYKGFPPSGQYDDMTKKLVMYGKKVISGGGWSGSITSYGLSPASQDLTTTILHPTATQFRIEAVVVPDKSHYLVTFPDSASRIPNHNSYSLTALYTPFTTTDTTNTPIIIAHLLRENVTGERTLTLLIKQKADGTPFTANDFRNIKIVLGADYDYEVKSIKVIPLN